MFNGMSKGILFTQPLPFGIIYRVSVLWVIFASSVFEKLDILNLQMKFKMFEDP